MAGDTIQKILKGGVFMGDIKRELLSNKEVIEEINRHRWLESEKAGHDVGFDSAAEDWLKKFSIAWMQYNMPERLIQEQSKKESNGKIENTSGRKTTRRARSYY